MPAETRNVAWPGVAIRTMSDVLFARPPISLAPYGLKSIVHGCMTIISFDACVQPQSALEISVTRSTRDRYNRPVAIVVFVAPARRLCIFFCNVGSTP